MKEALNNNDMIASSKYEDLGEKCLSSYICFKYAEDAKRERRKS